jgi:hypothetical protein
MAVGVSIQGGEGEEKEREREREEMNLLLLVCVWRVRRIVTVLYVAVLLIGDYDFRWTKNEFCEGKGGFGGRMIVGRVNSSRQRRKVPPSPPRRIKMGRRRPSSRISNGVVLGVLAAGHRIRT